MESLMPVIPPYAVLLFGNKWGGWAWQSIQPITGRCIWWVLFYEQGESLMQARWFTKIENLEQWCDTKDGIDGGND